MALAMVAPTVMPWPSGTTHLGHWDYALNLVPKNSAKEEKKRSCQGFLKRGLIWRRLPVDSADRSTAQVVTSRGDNKKRSAAGSNIGAC